MSVAPAVARALTACALAASTLGSCTTGVFAPSPVLAADPGPRFNDHGRDAVAYGAGRGYPVGTRQSFARVPYLVGSQSHLDAIFPSRTARRAASPSTLDRVPEPSFTYGDQGQRRTVDDYLARQPVTGLLIARGDTILVERYQYARRDTHRFASWSAAKTVTAMLVGIAVTEGRIRSLDDTADAYVTALRGTEYGRTTIRDLLQMSSGLRDNRHRLFVDTFLGLGAGGVSAVARYNDRVSPAGTVFAYASADTQTLGLILQAATGRSVAAYLEKKIWQPMGAEADATWLVDRSGQEATYCCLNAVLRDYARLGLLLAHDGEWRGREIVPATWVREATSVASGQPHLRPGIATKFLGYGYQTWLLPGARRMFAALGARGQIIFVDPHRRLVMVQTAVSRQRVDPGEAREALELWRGIVEAFGT